MPHFHADFLKGHSFRFSQVKIAGFHGAFSAGEIDVSSVRHLAPPAPPCVDISSPFRLSVTIVPFRYSIAHFHPFFFVFSKNCLALSTSRIAGATVERILARNDLNPSS